MGCTLSNKLRFIYESISADTLLREKIGVLTEIPDIVIAIGKAANEMCKAAYELKDSVRSLIICPESSEDYDLPNCERIIGSHPYVDTLSLYAGEKLVEFIAIHKNRRLMFLISGGGSALVERLTSISHTLYHQCISELMNFGADITELNTVRKHLSDIKGGRLLKNIHPESHAFILNDIPFGCVENVASGLTFKDESTASDAENILQKYEISEKYSQFLTETPKDITSIKHTVIGDNAILLCNIKTIYENDGYDVIISDYPLKDYANITGLNIGCQILKYAKKCKKKTAIIYGGETTVNVRGNGVGGRVLEMALAIAIEISGLQNVQVICSATDGKDGNSPAAGVVINGDTASGVNNPHVYLKNNDSYHAFVSCAEVIPQFKSRSNLNDFVVVEIN